MKVINWSPSRNSGVFLEVYLQGDETWSTKEGEFLSITHHLAASPLEVGACESPE